VHADKRVTLHSPDFVTDAVEPDPLIVGSILERAACYFRELDRTSASQEFENYIEVKFYKLDPPRIRLPGRSILECLVPVEPNLCRDNIIDFVVEDSSETKSSTPYGFKIVNPTKENLYVNAFYFDNTNFSISESKCNFAHRNNGI
jgi:hypothetical protein